MESVRDSKEHRVGTVINRFARGGRKECCFIVVL